jgi:hypothetical protein
MRKAIYIIFLIYSCNVFAEQKTVIVGAGTSTCKQFLESIQEGTLEEENPTRTAFVSWAQGYVSGRNKQLEYFEYKMKLIPSQSEYWNILTFGCRKAKSLNNEEMQLSTMLDQLFSDVFSKNLIKKP